MTRKEIHESIAVHATEASRKLRKQESVASAGMIFIRTSPFSDMPQYSARCGFRFDTPTSDMMLIVEAAIRAVDEVFKGGFEYKKAGVTLFDVSEKGQFQLSLFSKSKNRDELMRCIDFTNNKYGKLTLRSASCGVRNFWKKGRSYSSKCFTTRLSDLDKVK